MLPVPLAAVYVGTARRCDRGVVAVKVNGLVVVRRRRGVIICRRAQVKRRGCGECRGAAQTQGSPQAVGRSRIGIDAGEGDRAAIGAADGAAQPQRARAAALDVRSEVYNTAVIVGVVDGSAVACERPGPRERVSTAGSIREIPRVHDQIVHGQSGAAGSLQIDGAAIDEAQGAAAKRVGSAARRRSQLKRLGHVVPQVVGRRHAGGGSRDVPPIAGRVKTRIAARIAGVELVRVGQRDISQGKQYGKCRHKQCCFFHGL